MASTLRKWPGECVIIHGRPRHPQSQGLVEQANKTVQTMISTMKTHNLPPHNWSYWLNTIQLEMNIAWQSCIKTLPYKVVFGQLPNRENLPGTK